MIRNGGRWKKKNGGMAGEGSFYHWCRAINLLWPFVKLHKWNLLTIEKYLEYRTIGVIGPASSGKTNTAALCALLDYYVFPSCTTVICCSTTKERLEDRIWGEIKKLHRQAKEVAPWIDGHLIEGRQRIITDDRTALIEGRDFRNGLVGVPCKKGDSYVGLGDFAGLKNKRVRLFGDELSLLPRVFVDAVSNLDKNPDFKAMGLGNPKETTDALGVFCEPAPGLGGWDGGIDQTPETKSWLTRRPQGVCIQLPGTDSPNLDGKLGIPLITQEQIDRDVAFYGKDSLWFTMMDQGMMPRGQGSRRIITRQICLKGGAMEDPVWKDSARVQIGFLDAAYGGVGGDRCVFGKLQFGEEIAPLDSLTPDKLLISQNYRPMTGRKILHLIGLELVPITNQSSDPPEYQIAEWVRNRCVESNIPPENFFFDAGSRSSLVAAFAKQWSNQVVPIDFGGKPSERKVAAHMDVSCRDYYSKFVSELWFSARYTIEAGQFRGMTEDVMMEGCSREWKIVAGNKHEVETKEDMKLKTGRSPDLFDALVCGIEGARQRGFVIMRLASVRGVREDTRWKRELENQAKKFWKVGSLDYAA
jgi:hypothetical protein